MGSVAPTAALVVGELEVEPECCPIAASRRLVLRDAGSDYARPATAQAALPRRARYASTPAPARSPDVAKIPTRIPRPDRSRHGQSTTRATSTTPNQDHTDNPAVSSGRQLWSTARSLFAHCAVRLRRVDHLPAGPDLMGSDCQQHARARGCWRGTSAKPWRSGRALLCFRAPLASVAASSAVAQHLSWLALELS